jgi:acyl-CoA thioesterase FadM
MYPLIRLTREWIRTRNAPPLPLDGLHVTPMRCMPWDIDMWMELNNGRTLTLYDVGRLALGQRIGLVGAIKRRGWGLTMAGASVRFRRRVRMFDKFDVRTAAVGRDSRFFYIEQSMWRNGEATSSVLYRSAVTDAKGIVPTQEVVAEMGDPNWNPPLPAWVDEWIRAEGHRPWPPVTGDVAHLPAA